MASSFASDQILEAGFEVEQLDEDARRRIEHQQSKCGLVAIAIGDPLLLFRNAQPAIGDPLRDVSQFGHNALHWPRLMEKTVIVLTQIKGQLMGEHKLYE